MVELQAVPSFYVGRGALMLPQQALHQLCHLPSPRTYPIVVFQQLFIGLSRRHSSKLWRQTMATKWTEMSVLTLAVFHEPVSVAS